MLVYVSYVGLLGFSTLVEGLEEVGLTFEDNFIVEIITMITGDVLTAVATLRSKHISNVGTPNISILHVVETFVALLAERVDALNISHFVVLDPVVSELELGLVRSSVFAHSVVSDDPWHESAVLTEQAEGLEMGFSKRARLGRCGDLVGRQVTLDSNIVNGREIVSNILFHEYISSRPPTHICLINKKL